MMCSRLLLLFGFALLIANAAVGAIVKLEAENAVLGADYAVVTNDGATGISITSNTTGESPGSAARVATFAVTFPSLGTYNLFARVRVGTNAANDDSLFYATEFGTPASDDSAGWIRVNNLVSGGYTGESESVVGSGSAGTLVWKWVNLSEFTNSASEAPGQFTVASGGLTQTFQIGAREDGLDVDAIAFGSADYTFTVADLDAGAGGHPPSAGRCTVNWNDARQRIDGFGASSAWRWTMSSTVADRYFSTNTGIGLSLLRTRIAPGGTTVEAGIMQLARDRGARVWSAPWSPAPAEQFKSNTNVNGGSFIGNAVNYQAYANQLAGYVANMKSQYGVALYALSIQNEPDANVTTYESCKWTGQQIHDFVPYLSAALAASNVASTKIMLPESQNWTDPQGLRSATMNDSSTASLVGIIANHNYVPDNDNGDQATPAALNSYGKALWETEVSTFSDFDGSITNGIYWAKRIHAFLTVAQANAWHYWWLAASDNSGIANSSDVLAKRAYVLGQYSRFVRPDFYRIGATSNFGNALVSAFKDPVSSRFAIVAINPTDGVINQTFSLANFGVVTGATPWITSAALSLASQPAVTVSNSEFSYSLPAMSVVTFVGQRALNLPPVLAKISDRTVSVGTRLSITNVVFDANVPPQILAFSALAKPANAALDSSSGVLSWRPTVGDADTTNQIAITVKDDGSPALSATNRFIIVVKPLTAPALGLTTGQGGQVNLSLDGDAGPDYTLWTSTNLSDWQMVLITNPPALPLSLELTNGSGQQRFFRIEVGP